jgi:hypothetical protein
MSSKPKSKRSAQAPTASDDSSLSSKEARLSTSPSGCVPQPTTNVGRFTPSREEVEVESSPPVRTMWVPPPAAGPQSASVAPQLPSPPASVSSADNKEEAVMDVDDVDPAIASSPAASLPAADSQIPHDIDLRRLKSFHVGADKLMFEADIDARSPTHFKFSLAVDPRYPEFTPVDLAAFSFKNSNRALAGFNASVKLLDASDQLAIHAPRIPRVLVGLMTKEETTQLSASLTAGQQEWLARIGEHMKDNAAGILSGQGSERRRFAVSNELVGLLTSALSLWKSEELTNLWSEILMKDTTVKRILQEEDNNRATSSQNSAKQNQGRGKWGKRPTNPYFYMLHLQCAGREIAYIVGCILTRCALLPLQSDMLPLTKQLMHLLDGVADPLVPAESTDSDDSDSEDPRSSHSGWKKAKGKRPKRFVSGYERHRLVRERLTQGIKALQKQPEFKGVLSSLRQESERPLLLLSTHISSLRAWVTRYTSIQVDNLHTICDMGSADILREDHRFLALSTIPQLALPNASWKITQTDTGVYTALWMREDMTDILPKLPELIQQKLGLDSIPPLIFRCTYWQTTRSGRIIPKSAITVSANDNVKIARPSVPSNRSLPALYQPPSVPAAPSVALPARRQALPAPPDGSWAHRVLNAAVSVAQKRTASNPSLNHKPRKDQRTADANPPSASAPRSQSSTTTTNQPAASSSPPPPSSSSSSSASAAPAKRHNQAVNSAAFSESALSSSMASMIVELKEQREELAAYREEMTAYKSHQTAKDAQWEQLMTGMQSQLKELQNIVMENNRGYNEVKEMIRQLAAVVNERFTGSMSISSVTPSGHGMAHPQPSTPTPSPLNTADIHQLQQLLQVQQQQMHQLQLLSQQQQQASSTIRSASAIPARNDSGMAVSDA